MKFFLTVFNIILESNTKETKDMAMKMKMMNKKMRKKNKKVKRKRNHQKKKKKKKKNQNQKERVIKGLQLKSLNVKINEMINLI